MATPLIVPGLYGSCSQHWQSWLEQRLPFAHRVLQANWDKADIGAWSEVLDGAILRQSDRVILIAHSFGCLVSAAAAAGRSASRISGALLVAPCDTQRVGVDERLLDIDLPFPSTLVASRNDPWMSFSRAEMWADRWGSRLVDAGHKGHINVASGHGPWSEVLSLIAELSSNPDVLVLKRADRPPLDCAV
jgi:predicted alpha/beta hydrolase family esterase